MITNQKAWLTVTFGNRDLLVRKGKNEEKGKKRL